MKAAKAANPDAFVAWSYPPDTFGLAGAGQDRRSEREGLLQRGRGRVPGVQGQVRQLDRERARRRRHSGHARRSATTTRGTRKSPASMPTTGAARCTTRSCRFSTQSFEGVGSLDREAITDSPQEEHVQDHRSATSISASSSSTATGPSASGRTASSMPSPASASPTTSRCSLKTGWAKLVIDPAPAQTRRRVSIRDTRVRWTSSSSACCSAAPTR